MWVIRWQSYRSPDQAVRLQTARGFERDDSAPAPPVVESGRSFTARRLYRKYALPIAAVGLFYLSSSERVQTPPTQGPESNIQVVAWKSYRAPKHHVRLYYFQTADTGLSAPAPAEESGRSNLARKLYRSWKTPSQVTSLYYHRGSERSIDRVEPIEFGRHFVARRFYSPFKAPLTQISNLYYHTRGQIETAVSAESGRSFATRRITKRYKAPRLIRSLYYQSSLAITPPDVIAIILKFDLFFQVKHGLSSRFGVKPGQDLHFQVKLPKGQRF